jgi:hypothetical protein
MNSDDFEKRLQHQTLRQIPPEWRAEILSVVRPATARFSLARTPLAALFKLGRELILAYPRIWAGLAAAWIVIFALHFSSRDTSPALVKNSPPPSREMLAAIQNQKRMLAEMLLDSVKSNDADRPKSSAPAPHSERVMPVIVT